jgi:DNA-binding response OmpR family regulator
MKGVDRMPIKMKLLIIDDERSICNLIKLHFETEGYIVYAASNAQEGKKLLASKPDLILLDINMPDVNGIDFCRGIRKYIDCPILFLTSRVTEQDKILGLQAGGDDYITKPFSIAELSARVEAHLRREKRGNHKNVKMYGNLVIDYNGRSVYFLDDLIPFSKKEFDVIELLSLNEGQVFTKEILYERIWGYLAEGNSEVIKEHIRKIRGKFQEVTGCKYIETVWGVGYKWIGI